MAVSDIVTEPAGGAAEGAVAGAKAGGVIGALTGGALGSLPGLLLTGFAIAIAVMAPPLIPVMAVVGIVGAGIAVGGGVLGAIKGGIGGAAMVGAGGGLIGLGIGALKGIKGFVEGLFTKVAPGRVSESPDLQDLRAQSAATDAQYAGMQQAYLDQKQQAEAVSATRQQERAAAQASVADPNVPADKSTKITVVQQGNAPSVTL